MTEPFKAAQGAVKAATPRGNKEIIGFLLIAVGALLLYCGMKDYQPIPLIKNVLSGADITGTPTLSGKQPFLGKKLPTDGTTPSTGGGTVVNT